MNAFLKQKTESFIFVKNVPMPETFLLDFSKMENGDYFKATKDDLGRNGIGVVLSRAEKFGVQLLHRISVSGDIVEFWCEQKINGIFPEQLAEEITLLLTTHGKLTGPEIIEKTSRSYFAIMRVLRGLIGDGRVACREEGKVGRGRPTKIYCIAQPS